MQSRRGRKRILILGGGTGGTRMANRLVHALPDWRITIVDRDDAHLYQPGPLLLTFGAYRPEELVRPRRKRQGDLIDSNYGCTSQARWKRSSTGCASRSPGWSSGSASRTC